MNLYAEQKKRKIQQMGISRRHLLVGLVLVMILGIAVYSRLWVIDYKISAVDTELLRRQFDLAHREAVDESAEWRLRFDQERDRSTECMKELAKVKELLNTNVNDTAVGDERVQRLQRENAELVKRLESLKRELELEKLRCNSQ